MRISVNVLILGAYINLFGGTGKGKVLLLRGLERVLRECLEIVVFFIQFIFFYLGHLQI